MVAKHAILIIGASALCLFTGLILRADDTTPPTATPPAATSADSTSAATSAPGATTPPIPTLPAPEPPADPTPAKSAEEKVADSLKWQTGTIKLKEGLAKINLNDGFRFLDHENAEKVLHDIWGNPSDPNTLGMIFPVDMGLLDKGSWGVVIQYEEEGYVKDNDANKLNYDDMLKRMQQEINDNNAERVKEGYPAINLVGWAAPPHYDKETHKLYWAKNIKFGDDKENTLNYNIRVLGRRGVLVLNAIAGMNDFAAIDKKMPEVISMVDFQAGNTYADFDPKVDKIAEYGLATLIAGGAIGAALKLGLLGGAWKFILAGLIAFKKLIILAVVAIGAFFKKIFGRFSGKSSTPNNLLPPENRSPQ